MAKLSEKEVGPTETNSSGRFIIAWQRALVGWRHVLSGQRSLRSMRSSSAAPLGASSEGTWIL
jgi:hypothetical protein